MKKRMLLLGLLFAGSVAALAAEGIVRGEGPYESNTLDNLPAFHAVEVLGDADVEIVQRATPKVIVSGLANLTALAEVKVENGTLVVSYKKPVHVKGKHHLHVMIGAPHFAAITAAHNSDIKVLGALTGEELTLTARDQGEIKVNHLEVNKLVIHAADQSEIEVEKVKVNHLEVKTFNKAEVDISGHTEQAWLENNGSGDIEADGLYVREANVMTFSSGDIKTRVLTKLHAVANGHGKIEYKGSPSQLVREGHLKSIKHEE